VTLGYGSLFAGAGLLDFGLHAELPGLRCQWAAEIDDDRRTIFGAHFPSAALHGDITALDHTTLERVDGIIGGIPCNTHSTSNTAGERGLAPQWEHARRILEHLAPTWTLWESSEKDQSWRRWVPPVRRDLWAVGHASVCFRVRTAGRGAPHDRERAIIVSWSTTADAHRDGECSRAVHEEVARLRSAPAVVWDGRIPAGIGGRLADGLDARLARAIGLGVDQRTAEDAGRVLGALIGALV
jgi:site-specific DNA-cytosine methylase